MKPRLILLGALAILAVSCKKEEERNYTPACSENILSAHNTLSSLLSFPALADPVTRLEDISKACVQYKSKIGGETCAAVDLKSGNLVDINYSQFEGSCNNNEKNLALLRKYPPVRQNENTVLSELKKPLMAIVYDSRLVEKLLHANGEIAIQQGETDRSFHMNPSILSCQFLTKEESRDQLKSHIKDYEVLRMHSFAQKGRRLTGVLSKSGGEVMALIVCASAKNRTNWRVKDLKDVFGKSMDLSVLNY